MEFSVNWVRVSCRGNRFSGWGRSLEVNLLGFKIRIIDSRAVDICVQRSVES